MRRLFFSFGQHSDAPYAHRDSKSPFPLHKCSVISVVFLSIYSGIIKSALRVRLWGVDSFGVLSRERIKWEHMHYCGKIFAASRLR